ncbi:hypothetical protein EHQ58_13960 [Leptospira ognonensis]|uniref:Uncharacterized protein n=1 Tax=Leptospira ognonensis TaxID=2484945 RepID=A0A4R9JY03_9LEPT|nr:hypothetical protein [Leptospira ognonensis]TGL57392.1 hypothetical protein EHQ58_13960 [Leptospira ognonensis]
MSPTDEIQKSLESSIFHPYQHQDYYGWDSLFLSPLKFGEVWNLLNVPSVSPGLLAFLTLRSYLTSSMHGQKIELTGLSRNWKTYLARSSYLQKNTNLFTQDFIPEIVKAEDTISEGNDILKSQDWKNSLRLEFSERGKKTLFYVASSKVEGVAAKNLSEMLSQFLVESQRNDRLTRAYIRKESSSYLYIQSEEQIHPRVFFKDDATQFPEFLLFIAELIPIK